MNINFSELPDKIDVSRVLIERADGIYAKARVSTIQAANHILESWAGDVPEAGDELCEVRIVFEDGLQYRSQFRLDRSLKRISLARHVRRELTALASLKRCKAQDKDPAPSMSPVSANLAESAQLVLDRYDI